MPFFSTIEKYLYVAIGVVFAVLVIALFITRADLKETKKQMERTTMQLEQCVAQSKALNDSILSYNEADKKANQTIYQLRKLIMEREEALKNEEKSCNCYNLPIPDDIIGLLHTNNSGKTKDTSTKLH